MLQRNEKYGQSWKILDISTIAQLCQMKLYRIGKLELDPKTEDEFIDVINYCYFALIKIKNIKSKIKN